MCVIMGNGDERSSIGAVLRGLCEGKCIWNEDLKQIELPGSYFPFNPRFLDQVMRIFYRIRSRQNAFEVGV
jgi:hypothetical protein